MVLVFAIPFFAFAAALVLSGLAQSSTAQHGSEATGSSLYQALTGTLHAITGLAAKALRATVSRFASANLPHLTAYFTSLALIVGATGRSVAQLAEAMDAAVRRVYSAIDGKVAAQVSPVKRTAHSAAKTATQANQATHANRDALNKYKATTTPKVQHATHAVDVAIPHDLAGLRARNKALEQKQAKTASDVKALEDGAVKTFEWIRSHPLSAVTGVFAGAVAVALSRLGFGFLRCRSWQNLGRQLKCSDANLLSDLLLGLTTSIFAISLVEMAEEEQKVIEAVATAVRDVLEV